MAKDLLTTDKLLKFIYAVAAGMNQDEAYIQHYSRNGKCKKATARTNASELLAKPANRELLAKARQERVDAMKLELQLNQQKVAKEFIEKVLTVDQLDSFHSSVIQGFVEVEEYVPIYTVEEILDHNGRVIKKIRKPGLSKITRKPNIREKQVSVDALYKRNGNYAPGKVVGAFGNVNDDGEVENIKRFVIMANGDRMPMP